MTGRVGKPTGLSSPTEPSSTVSALPGFDPSRCWLSKVPNSDIYAVVGPDGSDIGYVRKVFRTIEKGIPGKQYVAWRRKAKTPSWRCWLKARMEEPSRGPNYGSRKRAVAELLHDYASAIEARSAETTGSARQGESAVPNGETPPCR